MWRLAPLSLSPRHVTSQVRGHRSCHVLSTCSSPTERPLPPPPPPLLDPLLPPSLRFIPSLHPFPLHPSSSSSTFSDFLRLLFEITSTFFSPSLLTVFPRPPPLLSVMACLSACLQSLCFSPLTESSTSRAGLLSVRERAPEKVSSLNKSMC